MFDAVKVKNDCVQWIRDYFQDNPDGKAIIGISGGKDSTICAALLVEALGADRVIGVLMPNGIQSDINDSYRVCNYQALHLSLATLRLRMLKFLQRADLVVMIFLFLRW